MDTELPDNQEDQEDPNAYEDLGWYFPEEAYKLLKHFDDGGVEAMIGEKRGDDSATAATAEIGWFGRGPELLISIRRSCRERALEIHREIFGDGLPDPLPEETPAA